MDYPFLDKNNGLTDVMGSATSKCPDKGRRHNSPVKAAEGRLSWWVMSLTVTNLQQPSCDDSPLSGIRHRQVGDHSCGILMSNPIRRWNRVTLKGFLELGQVMKIQFSIWRAAKLACP